MMAIKTKDDADGRKLILMLMLLLVGLTDFVQVDDRPDYRRVGGWTSGTELLITAWLMQHPFGSIKGDREICEINFFPLFPVPC